MFYIEYKQKASGEKMEKNIQQDMEKLNNIVRYLNNIEKCFKQHDIGNANNLKNDEVAQAACTQFKTNIYECKNKLQDVTYNQLTELNKIKIAGARHIASHEYDSIDFRAIYAICKQLTKPIVFSEIYKIISEIKAPEEDEVENESGNRSTHN